MPGALKKIIAWPGLVLLFVFAFFFLLNLRQILDYDVWFQLIAGQETARTLAVPKAEFYIYSAIGEPSQFVGWLWGLLLYLAWRVGGYDLMSFFNAAVWAAVYGVAAAAILARTSGEVDAGHARKAVLAAILIAAGVAHLYLVERSAFRAEVTLYLAWVIGIYLSAGIFEDRQRLHRFLVGVPLLSWALGWLHTTSVFMVLLLVGYALQALWAVSRRQGYVGLATFVKGDGWRWGASIIAAMALPCLNPNGVQQALPLVIGLAEAVRGMLAGGAVPGEVVHSNLEYRHLAQVPGLWPTAALYVAASLLVLWRDRSHRVANATFLLTGLVLSFLHIRALATWAVFLIVPLGVALMPLLQAAAVQLRLKRREGLIGVLAFMACFFCLGTLFNKEAKRWGIGYVTVRADEIVLQQIRASMPHGGRIFNWFPLGGYVRWSLGPDYQVSIDGHLTNPDSVAWKAYYDIEDVRGKGLELIDKWKIQAVYHPVLTPPNGYIHWLPHDLVYSDHWRLVAGDRHGLLFVRARPGELDESTRKILQLAYWRKVMVDARYVELGLREFRNDEAAREAIQLAEQRIKELQKESK